MFAFVWAEGGVPHANRRRAAHFKPGVPVCYCLVLSTTNLWCADTLFVVGVVGCCAVGRYRQKIDFSNFPGPVIATTNCVLDPPKSYKNRLFTTNEVGAAGQLGSHCWTAVLQRFVDGFQTASL